MLVFLLYCIAKKFATVYDTISKGGVVVPTTKLSKNCYTIDRDSQLRATYFESLFEEKGKYIYSSYLNYPRLDERRRCKDPVEDNQLLESPSALPTVPVKDGNSKKFISALKAIELSPETNRYVTVVVFD